MSSLSRREQVVQIAEGLVGEPSIKYVSGHPELGQSPAGFDCSGLVTHVLKRAGLFVPKFMGQDGMYRDIRHANEYWDYYGVAVHEEFVEPGDLLFFSKNGLYTHHVGIVTSPDTYVHSPGKDDEFVEERPIEHEDILAPPEDRQLYKRNPIGYKTLVCAHDNATYRYHQGLLD